MRWLVAFAACWTVQSLDFAALRGQQLPAPATQHSQQAETAAPAEQGSKPRSLNEPLTAEEQATPVEEFKTPEDLAGDAFDPPPGAKSLSKRNVWVDREKQRVFIDGYVAMREGPLEMFACPAGTKEHESIVASLARSSEVHAALLAVGAKPGTPVQYLPNFVPATGQRIRVWVLYRDAAGKFQAVDARKWIRKAGTDQQMDSDWVFAGSGFWKDPEDGREFYQADSGDMICVSNFNTAMLDVPIASSAQADDLLFIPYTSRIPEPGTPVRLVLMPIPIPTDAPKLPEQATRPEEATTPSPVDPDQPPEETVLPAKSKSPAEVSEKKPTP
jgi:hypothetical protein